MVVGDGGERVRVVLGRVEAVVVSEAGGDATIRC
jgi:hypothetical protein